MGAFTSLLMAAGIGMTAYGQYKEGQDAYAAAEYNAEIYRQQAATIDVKKTISAHDWDRTIRKLEGKSIATIAGSGYDPSGSFLTYMNDQLTQAQLDKQEELYNLEVSKSQSMSSADEAMREGARKRTAALIGSTATILTMGNEWYDKYGPTASTTAGAKGKPLTSRPGLA